MHDDDKEPVYKIIARFDGTHSGGINWDCATFDNDETGQACFRECLRIWPDMDHRGYYLADPTNPNDNLHRGGFRYRF